MIYKIAVNIFIVIIDKTLMNISELANRAFTFSSPIQNYKELYEQAKKNVSLFISQVDKELSKILIRHQQQISKLKGENQALRQQIKGQSQSVVIYNQLSSLKQRRNASTKSYSHEKMKDFIDCELSQISLTESKSMYNQKKKHSIISYILQDKNENTDGERKGKHSKQTERNTSIGNYDKQNIWSEPNSDLIDLKTKLSQCRKAKRTNISMMNDHESVKGVLKNLRDKANTPVRFQDIMKRQAQQRPKNIIVPQMFESFKK